MRRHGPGSAVIWFRVQGRVEFGEWVWKSTTPRLMLSDSSWESQLEGPCGFLKGFFFGGGGLL